MPTAPETVLRTYFHAKDGNRPHLLDAVFTPDVRLEVVNRSANIAFPAVTEGRAAASDVLVGGFGRTYENVYSFYLQRPVTGVVTFGCGWLVANSEKGSGRVRVGCGRYDWTFDAAQGGLARALTITIEAMELLPASALAPTLEWVGRLDYPWSSPEQVLRAMPQDAALRAVREALERTAT